MPDNGFGESFTLDLNDLRTISKVYPRTTRLWNDLKFVSDVSSIETSSLRLLERLRRGVCIYSFHWDEGINLFEDDIFFRHLRGDKSVMDQVAADLGGQKLVKEFWSEKFTEWRVFVHKNILWNHWEMFGPFLSQTQAEEVFQIEKQKGINNPPKRIRHGIYHNTGQINTVLLYEGFNLVSEFILTVGQGMPENRKSAGCS